MFLQTTAIDCLAGLVANPTLCAKHSQPVYIHNVNKKLKGTYIRYSLFFITSQIYIHQSWFVV